MELYELTLVVNTLQEKAIRDVFDQHGWKFIIAGVKQCAITRLPVPYRFPSDCEDYPEHCLTKETKVEDDPTVADKEQSLVSMDFKKSWGEGLQNTPGSSDYSLASSEDDDSDAEFHIKMKKVRSGEAQKVRQNRHRRDTRKVHGCSKIELSQGRHFPVHKIAPTTPVDKDMPKSATLRKAEKTALALPEEFHCGNCSESFPTFRDLRLHFAHHKLSDSRVNKSRSTLDKLSPRRKGRPPKKVRPSEQLDRVNRKVEHPLKFTAVTSGKEEKTPFSNTDTSQSLIAEIGSGTSKEFACRICSEEFTTFRDLRLHRQRHKESTDVPLSPTAKRKSDMPVRKIATQSRVCEICGKSFPNAAALKVHDRVHTGERPYLCNQCGKAFKQVSAFQNHLRTHTGETPFKCTMCEAAFRQLGELHRHQRRHTGEKPQLCTICGKRFAELGYLKSHMRLHTGEKPFSCRLCAKSFSQRTSLKCHMKSHHKNNLDISVLQSRAVPGEGNRNNQIYHARNDSLEDGEIQPEVNAPSSMDFQKQCIQDQVNSPAKTDRESQLVHQPQFIPTDPSVYSQQTQMKNYNTNANLPLSTLPPFTHLDPNIQPWIHFHGDLNGTGVY